MKHSKYQLQQAQQAIQKVKLSTKNEKIITNVQGLLTIVPHVGGPLCYILSEYRGKRNVERIFNALNKLKEIIEELSDEKRNILSEDEVIEIVQTTLEEIARTASDEKLRYLNNSLMKAFTKEDIVYSQKQFYLKTLRDLTLGELELIREIYLSTDPFVEMIPLRTPSNNFGIRSNHIYNIPTQYETRYEEPSTGGTLWEVLKNRLGHLSDGALQGIIDSLDSKGLSKISPNLEKSTVLIMTEIYYNPNQIEFRESQLHASQIDMVSSQGPQQTPVAASQTQFGRDFIQYIQL